MGLGCQGEGQGLQHPGSQWKDKEERKERASQRQQDGFTGLIKYFEMSTVCEEFFSLSRKYMPRFVWTIMHDLGPESPFGWKAFFTKAKNDHLKQMLQEKCSLRRS